MALEKQIPRGFFRSNAPVYTPTIFQIDVEWLLSAFTTFLVSNKLSEALPLHQKIVAGTMEESGVYTSSDFVEYFYENIAKVARISPNAIERLRTFSRANMSVYLSDDPFALTLPIPKEIWFTGESDLISGENIDSSLLKAFEFGAQFVRRSVIKNINKEYDVSLPDNKNPPIIDPKIMDDPIGVNVTNSLEAENRIYDGDQISLLMKGSLSDLTPINVQNVWGTWMRYFPTKLRDAELKTRWTGTKTKNHEIRWIDFETEVLTRVYSESTLDNYAFPHDIVPRIRYLCLGSLDTIHYKRVQIAVEGGQLQHSILTEILKREMEEGRIRDISERPPWMDLTLNSLIMSISKSIEDFFVDGTGDPREKHKNGKYVEEDQHLFLSRPKEDKNKMFNSPDDIESAEGGISFSILHLDPEAVRDKITINTIFGIIYQLYEKNIERLSKGEQITTLSLPSIIFFDSVVAGKAGTLETFRVAKIVIDEYSKRLYDELQKTSSSPQPFQFTKIVEITEENVDYFINMCREGVIWGKILEERSDIGVRTKVLKSISELIRDNPELEEIPLKTDPNYSKDKETKSGYLYLSEIRDIFFHSPFDTKRDSQPTAWKCMEEHAISRAYELGLVIGDMELELARLLYDFGVTQINLLTKIVHNVGGEKIGARGYQEVKTTPSEPLISGRSKTESSFVDIIMREIRSLNERLKTIMIEKFWKTKVDFLEDKVLHESVSPQSNGYHQHIATSLVEGTRRRERIQMMNTIVNPKVVISRLDEDSTSRSKERRMKKESDIPRERLIKARRNLMEEFGGARKEDDFQEELPEEKPLRPKHDFTKKKINDSAGLVTPITSRAWRRDDSIDDEMIETDIFSPSKISKYFSEFPTENGETRDQASPRDTFSTPIPVKRDMETYSPRDTTRRIVVNKKITDQSRGAVPEAERLITELVKTQSIILTDMIESDRAPIDFLSAGSFCPFLRPLTEEEQALLTPTELAQIEGERLRLLQARNANKDFCYETDLLKETNPKTRVDLIRERLKNEECILSGQIIFYIGELTDVHGLSLDKGKLDSMFSNGGTTEEITDDDYLTITPKKQSSDIESERESIYATPISSIHVRSPSTRITDGNEEYIIAPGIGVTKESEDRVHDMTPDTQNTIQNGVDTPIFVDVSGLTVDNFGARRGDLQSSIDHTLYGRAAYIYPFLSNSTIQKEKEFDSSKPRDDPQLVKDDIFSSIPFYYLLSKYNHEVGNRNNVPEEMIWETKNVKRSHYIKDTTSAYSRTSGAMRRKAHAIDLLKSQDVTVDFMKKKILFLEQKGRLPEEPTKEMLKKINESEEVASIVADVERYNSDDCFPYIMPFAPRKESMEKDDKPSDLTPDLSRMYVRFSILHALLQMF